MNRLLFIFLYRFIYKIRYRNLKVSIFSYIRNSILAPHVGVFGSSSVINSKIGAFSYINSSIVHNSFIGRYCSIAHGVIIGPGSHDLDKFSTSPVFESELEKQKFKTSIRVRIGSDVWIGVGATVLDGVDVSDGSVIAAGAVVTKNTEPYGIYAGIPAKLVRLRFSSEVVSLLVKSKWWELNPAEVSALNLNDLLKTP